MGNLCPYCDKFSTQYKNERFNKEIRTFFEGKVKDELGIDEWLYGMGFFPIIALIAAFILYYLGDWGHLALTVLILYGGFFIVSLPLFLFTVIPKLLRLRKKLDKYDDEQLYALAVQGYKQNGLSRVLDLIMSDKRETDSDL